MDIKCTTTPLSDIEVDAIAVGVFQERRTAAADRIDQENGGVIERLVESGEFKPDIGKVLPLYAVAGTKAPLVLIVGLGSENSFSAGEAFRAMGSATRWLTDRRRRSLAIIGEPDWSDAVVEAAVAGSMVGCQGTGLYQAQPSRVEPDVIEWNQVSNTACDAGVAIGAGVRLTRRLVNEPPSEIYPETFAACAEQVASESGMTIEVWDEVRLEQERCGSMLAVARGSVRPPRLVMVRHEGGASDAPWLALVGKGVTFDSGGLSLKPSAGMLTMKCDMAGAATVLGTMQAIARLQLPVNVMGFMGLVENMPGGNAFKLGDVLTTRSGKTIEVQNTDAEGRLVLADVLTVAVDLEMDRLIDLATLTGACVVALGNDVAGLMSNDPDWCQVIQQAADACGERVWPLPMFPEFSEQIKSSVADLRNVGEGRWGGAITAAKLLEEFVAGKPWTHIDIAGPAFQEKPKPWSDAGASGAMVRSLVQVVRDTMTPE